MNAMVQTLKEFSPMKLAAMGGAAAIIFSVILFIAFNMGSPVMSPIYSGLPMEDSAQIVTELEKMNVPYELRADGSQILVPSDQVLRLRMSMAENGLPSTGSVVGYEIFDRSEALGTSNFIHDVNMLRALEGELARTITSFAQVETARVHLVIPKRELFSRDKQEPTASVALKLRGSSDLGKSEIASISHLVATAVPGLKPAAITIVDNKGRLLQKGGADPNDIGALADESQEFRIGYENRLKNTIEGLLERSIGVGKVKAEVTADIDFDRIVTNSETFDPEGQVARSVQGVSETEMENSKDVNDNVSVANNLPDASQDKAGSTNSRQMERTDETTNYEISKEVVNHVKESGTVKRLSVAVLVDGTYAPDANGNTAYAPRPAAELQQLEELVRSAIGYDEARGDKVSVINMPFQSPVDEMADSGALGWLTDDVKDVVSTLAWAGVALLVFLLGIRPLIKRLIDTKLPEEEEERPEDAMALAGPAITAALTDQSEGEDEALINIDRINGRIKSSTFRKINELIDKHPDETVSILRQWVFKEA